MFKIVSWNVNSLKVRLPQVLAWLDCHQPDVLALQETKLTDANFPVEAITATGYQVIYSGQKTYNGVAILAKTAITDPLTDLPGFSDPQRRILMATVGDLRIVNLYVPNGSEVSSDKYQYKLAWLEAMTGFLAEEIKRYPRLVVLGDFNIAPADLDVHDPKVWQDCVLVSAPERNAFQNLLSLGLVDSFRQLYPQEAAYSWWDYRAAAFRRNMGLRIDHVLLSAGLIPQLNEAGIDKEARKAEQPSDHAPVWVGLSD